MGKICSIENCGKKNYGKGLCVKHWERLKKHGNPLALVNNFGEGETPEERFWSRVALTANPDKCWEWQGSKLKKGYGQVKFKGRNWVTHRLVWFLTYDVEPKMLILHSCDNPPCCNPSHLREGTNQENMNDKVERHRQAVGEKNGRAKLSQNDVEKIHSLLESGSSYEEAAAVFGVSKSHIGLIGRGQSRSED